MLKIITTPNPILNTAVKPIKKVNKKIKKLIKEMTKTLIAQKNPPGVGLAAPQVGFSLALFITKPTKKSPVKVFINPILKKAIFQKDKLIEKESANKNKKQTLEGCLSIPKIWGVVKRADKILLKYQDENGKEFEKWFEGFEAIIIQHEIDHLNGILFTKRVLEQKKNLYQEKDGKLEPL